jgi:hypothetical protein
LKVGNAVIRIDAGESFRSVARDISNLSQVLLSRVHNDDQYREWYLDGAAEDEQIDETLGQVTAGESRW